MAMTKLEKLEKSIEELAPEELVRFREWFVEFEAKIWDAQIEHDAKAGRLDSLIAEALEEYRAGKAREI
jgi:hypothetical protein